MDQERQGDFSPASSGWMPGASQDPRTARLPMKPADPSLPFSLDRTGVRSPGGPEPHLRPGLGTLAECHPLWEPRSTRGERAAPAAGGVVPSKPGGRWTASGSESAPGGQMARPATLLITSRRQLPGPRDKDKSGVCVRCHLTSAGGSRGQFHRPPIGGTWGGLPPGQPWRGTGGPWRVTPVSLALICI